MKKPLPPDLIALACPPIIVVVCVAFIVILIDDNPTVRTALIVFLGCIPPVFAFFWQSSGLRLCFFRCYYRYRGPNCNVRILGEIPVDPNKGDEELLNTAVGAIMCLKPTPEQIVRLSNRRVVSHANRMLTFDAVNLDVHQDWEDEGDEESDEYVGDVSEWQDRGRRVAFNLAGYDGKLTEVDSLLRTDVAYLLECLNDAVKRQDALPIYSLRVTIEGGNPFLVFYLKDIPTKDTEQFNLRLVSGEGASQVAVNVSLDFIDVSARTPARLLESAREYLASPALDRS